MTLVLFPDGTRAELGESDDRVVAVLPGTLAAVHRIELPGLTDKQARAAARLTAAEASLSPIDALHVAIGGDDDGWRTVVAADRGVMGALLTLLAEEGIDPDAVVPATLLLARPEGAVRTPIAGETVVRTGAGGYVEEPGLAGLFGDVPRDLSADEAARQIAAAVAMPEVDLRQGEFARSRGWRVDWVAARRLGWLALTLLVLTLAIELITLMRIDATAKRIEQANAAAATSPATPRALPLAGLAVAAVASTLDTEIGALSVDGAGALRLTGRGRSAAALDQLQARLAGSGLRMNAGPTVMMDGRASRELTLGAP
jgi:general secretion pathway protein L